MKKFCSSKIGINKIKSNQRLEENIVKTFIVNKFIFRMYNELVCINNGKKIINFYIRLLNLNKFFKNENVKLTT